MPGPIQVEARSLAALNNLASNPPQYPRNPAHGRQEPLTLYISRVPGTKDVILSTFRPGLKSVTAEDIASSLYYVHHELPSAATPAQRPRQVSDTRPSFESTLGGDPASHKPIRRKPVPGSGPTSPVAPGPPSPTPLQIPSSPSSQLDVHPLLRTPVVEPPQQPPPQTQQQLPSYSNQAPSPTNLKPSPSFSAYRPGAGLPSPPPTLHPSGGPSPQHERSFSPARTPQYESRNLSLVRSQYEMRSFSPGRNEGTVSTREDVGRLEDDGLHIQNLSPGRPDGSFRAYSPLNSAPSPQPDRDGQQASTAMRPPPDERGSAPMDPPTIARTPSPPKPARTQSKASEHPALPSARRALEPSAPASPVAAVAETSPYSSVFQALDDFEPAPPVPPKHPRRLSEANILGGMTAAQAQELAQIQTPGAGRPITPADTPMQLQTSTRSPPPGYSPGAFVPPATEKPAGTDQQHQHPLRSHPHHPLQSPPQLQTHPQHPQHPQHPLQSHPQHQHSTNHQSFHARTPSLTIAPPDHGRRSLDTRIDLFTPPPNNHAPSPGKNSHLHPHAPPTHGQFTLTLIRREPSSGQQWNVGRITALTTRAADHPDENDQSPPLLHIHVDTLGYAKFVNPISYRQYAGMDPRQTMATTPVDAPHAPTTPSAVVAAAPALVSASGPPAFQREVRAAYGKRWRSNLKGLFRRSHHAGVPSSSSPSGRRGSDDSAGSLDGDGHPHASRDIKLRGYDFDSPWGGRCEFRTAEGGRNLRCQHHLPLEDVAPIPGSEGGAQMSRDPVSELRFNLPRQHHHHHPRSKSSSDVPTISGGGAQGSSLTGHFSRLMQRRGDEEEEDDGGWDDDDGLGMVSPFELNLGREKAGGGHHGKRAKMGKLIVYDAGLKMLDLVVAANVGLWWRLWDVQG